MLEGNPKPVIIKMADGAKARGSIFVYEGNDLLPGYLYTPYQHPPFSINEGSLAVLQKMELSSDIKATLLKWKRNQKVFKNKAELFLNRLLLLK
mgnify:CR=1 FL=1